MSKLYYGVRHTDSSINDSPWKISAWNTATVFSFQTEDARDKWVAESGYNWPCEGEYARAYRAIPYEEYEARREAEIAMYDAWGK